MSWNVSLANWSSVMGWARPPGVAPTHSQTFISDLYFRLLTWKCWWKIRDLGKTPSPLELDPLSFHIQLLLVWRNLKWAFNMIVWLPKKGKNKNEKQKSVWGGGGIYIDGYQWVCELWLWRYCSFKHYCYYLLKSFIQ